MGRSSGAGRALFEVRGEKWEAAVQLGSLFESRDVRGDVDGAHVWVLVDRDVVELGEGLERARRGERRGAVRVRGALCPRRVPSRTWYSSGPVLYM